LIEVKLVKIEIKWYNVLMGGHLETLTPEVQTNETTFQVESEACLNDCVQNLAALNSEITGERLVELFSEFGEPIQLEFVTQQAFADFASGNRERLESAAGTLNDDEVITQFSFNIENLPQSLTPLFQPLIDSGMGNYELSDVRVYLVTKPNIGFYGAFVKYSPTIEGRGLSVFLDENESITQAYVDDAGIIILDGAAIGAMGDDKFIDVLANETSHHLLNSARNIYINAVAQDYVGQPYSAMPDEFEIEAELVEGFSHPDLPPGDYPYNYFDEFLSDAASVMTNDAALGELLGRLSDIGNQETYGLSRDFYFHHLSLYLAENEGIEISAADLKLKLDEVLRLRALKQQTEIPEEFVSTEIEQYEILDTYLFDDSDFGVYWREKIIGVGIAFTNHVATKINEL